MKEGMSTEAHLKHMNELTDKLAAIGALISEEDQVETLLGSLPKSYSILVMALEARGDGLSLSYVQQALAHEEQKLSGESSTMGGVKEERQQASALIGREKGRT